MFRLAPLFSKMAGEKRAVRKLLRRRTPRLVSGADVAFPARPQAALGDKTHHILYNSQKQLQCR